MNTQPILIRIPIPAADRLFSFVTFIRQGLLTRAPAVLAPALPPSVRKPGTGEGTQLPLHAGALPVGKVRMGLRAVGPSPWGQVWNRCGACCQADSLSV